jgi:outer membrane receptor protein involved in Fe transport
MANRNVTRAVRLALIAAGTASVGAYAPGALAQEAELEQIVVTGSRIARPDYESASPVVSVSQQLFQQSGSASVDTVINALPQFVPSITSTSNNPSNAGQSNIDLRGLGSNRVLVLMDGRRVVPANGTGTVDLNLLPSSLIQNVEIISGGASAVYGSDAISGVVNFKLNTDFEGLEFDGTYGITEQGDGQEYQGTISAGTKFADGRGHIMGAVSYTERDEVLNGDRKFSEVALGYDTDTRTFVPSGSGTIEEGRVTVTAPAAAITQLFQQQYGIPGVTQTTYGFNADGTLFTLGTGAPGSVLNYKGPITSSFNDASYSYNYAPPNYLQLPLERTSVFAAGSFDVTDNHQVYAQGIYADYTVDTALAPTPLSAVYTPPTNPFIPNDLQTLLDARATPTDTFPLIRRMTEIGPRTESNEYEVYQFILGMQGDIAGDWTYDVYGSLGKVELNTDQGGNVSREAWEQLTFAPDGGVALCGGFNPFGAGAISPECAAYISRVTTYSETTEQNIFEATATGGLFELPAGKVMAVVGYMYKEDSYEFSPDETLARQLPATSYAGVRFDIAGFNAALPIEGDTDSNELFTEILVPILADMPGADRLEATLGYRYADYSSVGGVDSYKAELMWRPVAPVSLRGSYQRAVRAPSVFELFSPQVPNFPAYSPPDPCSVTSAERTGANAAAVRALCLAQGIPASLIDTYSYTNSQVEGLAGGNPDLTEETADTFTAGITFQSPSSNPWLSAFQLSVDYYSIEIEDYVTAVPARTFVARCYDPAYNPTFDVNNTFCNFFGRRSSDGNIVDALEANANVGSVETSGIDVQVDWAADMGPGRFSVNWIMTFLNDWGISEIPGDPLNPLEGTVGYFGAGDNFPEEKSTMNLAYKWGGWGMSAQWRYISEVDDIDTDTDFTLDSRNYFDLTASYAFDEGLLDGATVRVGVINVGDEDPVIYPSAQQANTDPTTYDVLGRRYFLNLNYKF